MNKFNSTLVVSELTCMKSFFTHLVKWAPQTDKLWNLQPLFKRSLGSDNKRRGLPQIHYSYATTDYNS